MELRPSVGRWARGEDEGSIDAGEMPVPSAASGVFPYSV
jgi:hypothetical protein